MKTAIIILAVVTVCLYIGYAVYKLIMKHKKRAKK